MQVIDIVLKRNKKLMMGRDDSDWFCKHMVINIMKSHSSKMPLTSHSRSLKFHNLPSQHLVFQDSYILK